MAEEFKILEGIISKGTSSFQSTIFAPGLGSSLQEFALGLNNGEIVVTDVPSNTISANTLGFIATSVGGGDNITGEPKFRTSGSTNTGYTSLSGSISFTVNSTFEPNTNILVSGSSVSNSSSVTLFEITGSNTLTPGFDALTMDYVIHNAARTKTVFGTLQAGWGGSTNPSGFQKLETRTTGISLPTSQFVLDVTTGASTVAGARVIATNTAGETMYITYERTLLGTDNNI
jgi:hypothetical protein